MINVQAATRKVTIKDAFFASAFITLTFAVLHFGLRASRAELQLQQLREHDTALSEHLDQLNVTFASIRSYTNTAQALASPEAPMHNRLASLTNPALAIEDLPVFGASETMFIAKRNDVERFLARLEQINALQARAQVLNQRLAGLADLLKANKSLVQSIPSIMPVEGRVSSEFGVRLSPFEGKRHMHAGIDIVAEPGAPVVAPADGVITFVGEFSDLGRTIVIDHGNGILTRFGHTQKFLVRDGQKVKRGRRIALVGNTGRSTGPHLHYEIWVNNNPVNPREFFFDLSERPTDSEAEGLQAVQAAASPVVQVAQLEDRRP